jgi:4-amino-4-deoxy-L-arabinose transferase-like glycosyltransferase
MVLPTGRGAFLWDACQREFALACVAGIGEMPRVNRRSAFVIVAALWAALYLPGLGSSEIKGEEGRRILPAVEMLEHGNWLVPYVGGEPYLRKPPLMNWAIALSMKMLGRRDEWAARLPSALAVLVLCGVIVGVSRPRVQSALTPEVAFVASMFVLGWCGLLAKARFASAEIEGLYVPLAGSAMVLWLVWWEQARSPWLIWTLPWVPLGLAVLAKGPLHLLFFYALVVAVLWVPREWRNLWHPAHGVGLALLAVIVAAWAMPFFHTPEASAAIHIWRDQFVGRVSENKFDLAGYALNLPRALIDLLPGALFVPVLWGRRHAWSGRAGAVVRGTLLAVVICFVVLLLIPGVLPRYVLPLGVPLAFLLALAVTEEQVLRPPATALRLWWRTNSGLALGLLGLAVAAPPLVVIGEIQRAKAIGEVLGAPAKLLVWPLFASAATIVICLTVFVGRRRFARPTRLAGASMALGGAASMLYAAAALPFITHADNLRPLAAAIDAAIPTGERLYLFDPEYQPVIFYLRTPYSYAPAIKDLPETAEFVLARSGNRKKLVSERPDLALAKDFGGTEKNRVLLLQRGGGIQNDAPPAGGR